MLNLDSRKCFEPSSTCSVLGARHGCSNVEGASWAKRYQVKSRVRNGMAGRNLISLVPRGSQFTVIAVTLGGRLEINTQSAHLIDQGRPRHTQDRRSATAPTHDPVRLPKCFQDVVVLCFYEARDARAR